jgi:hypothetical protein
VWFTSHTFNSIPHTVVGAAVQVGTVKISMPGMQKLKAAEKNHKKAKAKAKGAAA